jgi:hypothetical protein
MFADSDEGPFFQFHERRTSDASPAATVERLLFLLAIAAMLLVATVGIRSWTAVNDAKLPPIEYANGEAPLDDSPSWDQKRTYLTLPGPKF